MISLVVVAIRRGVATRCARGGSAGLLVLQILVGALNVWLDEYELLIVLHLALGTLLWAATLGLTLQLAPGARARARARRGGGGLMELVAARTRRGARAVVADYVELTKPRVQSLLLFTTVTTMYVAGDPSLGLVAPHLPRRRALGRRRRRDQPRARPRHRPHDDSARPTGRWPSGRVSPARRRSPSASRSACASFALLALTVNLLAAALALSGLLGYVFVYTLWLKRTTPQNIVIGGAAGAVPPLVAWAAVTGGLTGTPLYLFAIVFFWTPPHFWALSLLMKDEYARAGVPMLPVVRGERETRRQILLYTVLLVRGHASCRSAPARSAATYLVASVVLGAALHLRRRAGSPKRPDRRTALRLYLFSLAYLALLFAAMVADVRL